MPSQDTNPFASPEPASTRPEKTKLAAMPLTVALDEQAWPYEATELAEIIEIPKPWGRSISCARKRGKGRWIGSFLSLLAFIYFTFGFCFLFLSSFESMQTFAEEIALAMTVILLLGLFLPYTVYFGREDVVDRRRLSRLIRKRREAIETIPESDDPRFVVVVPRTRLSFSRYEMTASVAFAHIDTRQKQLSLDGDQFRFQIPVNSLLDVSVEQLRKYPTTYWFLRLVIQTQTGPQELCFRLGNTERLWQANSQREAEAKEYRDRILLLKKMT